MNMDKFTITSYDQFTGFDRATGNLELIMDELNDFTLAQEEEKVDIEGKGGRPIASMKKNKKVTGSGTNGMLSGGSLAAMLGTDIEDGEYEIKYTDSIIVKDNKTSTTEVAVGTPGNEIGTIYIRDEHKAYISGGKKLTQTAEEPQAGEFSYNPDTKEITLFAGDVADGTEVIVFYNAKVTGKKITNDANKYSKTLSSFLDVTCQDGCDNIFHGQFIIPRADFSGTFDIAGGSDPATQGFEFTSLPDLCTGKTDLWDFIVFD
ncbi:hypothetical protein FMM74_022060 [Lachnospiraceae bacterium MD308]|nr:hypothetical protein [Lachnospiraceae bacterium MD308]